MKKYALFIITLHTLSIGRDGQVFTMTEIPDDVAEINMAPYNNNKHTIEFRDGKGAIITPDPSWRKKVLITDPHMLKGMERRSTSSDTTSENNRKAASFCVVNSNDHTIIQNNSVVAHTGIQSCQSTETKSSSFGTRYFAALNSIFIDHKYKIILAACGACWLGVYARLSYLSYTISSSTSWSTWSEHLTLDGLQQTDLAVISQELLKDIHIKYAKRKTNFLSPLVNFINDVDAELAQINSFLQIHETLNAIKLAYIFPQQTSTVHLAIDRIQRLEFLKSIIIQATPEFKKKYLV